MSARATVAPRARVVGLAIVLAVTALGLEAAPAPRPAPGPERVASAPIPFGLGPDPVLAGYCASNPAFTGKLTQTLQNSGTPPTITRITTPTVYGWISNVDAAWSCTLYRRYSGLTWNVTSTGGIFAWGTIINSTSVSCNWAVGTTDYLKANNSTTCPTSDTHHAMAVTLSKERSYAASVSHNAEGQFSFVHSDCDTTPYYGANPIQGAEPGGVSYSTAIYGNRPGTNCDPIGLDATGTSQTVVYDKTAPAVAFDAPLGGPTTVTSATTTVGFDATDALAGFGGSNGWTLTRQVAPWTGSDCGTFVADTGGAVTTGTTSGLDQTVTQYLPAAACYRWTLSATDQNGNVSTTAISGTIRRTTDTLLGLGGYQHFESWDLGAGDTLAVNAATGNVVVSHPIVALPIRGGTLELATTYNSADPAIGAMGPGWRLNVERRLTVDGSGNVTFTDADGARHTFTNPTGSGTVTYTRPSTLYANLVRDTTATPDRFTLTYRDQSTDVFDELSTNVGYLTEQRDRHGNAVTFGYAGTTLASATDPAGRTVGFTWTGGRLTSITDWAHVSGGVVQASGSGNRVHEFFYDGGVLAGWDRPLAGGGACPTAAAHRVCLTYANGLLTGIGRHQTYTTLASGALSTGTRTATTVVGYRGGDIASVTDADGATTTFTRPAAGQLRVTRPGTPSSETTYGLVAPGDTLARVGSIWRTLGGSQIERRFAYSGTYPIEPFSVIDNAGAVLSTPAREVLYAYTTFGLVARITEPLDGTYTRWTDYTYNANHDVTQVIVSRGGDATLRTTTRYCYTTSGCATTATDLLLRATIERYVDGTPGGASGHVEDVTTTYQYDAYGQRIRETRANYAPGGTLLDQAATGWTYDTSGNLTAEIANYVNGTVTSPGDDVTPNATTNARTDLTTVHAYDTAGNRISTADPRRAIEAATGTSLAADDYVTRATFDAHNQATIARRPTTPGIADCSPAPGCRETVTAYDEFGLVRTVTEPGGRVTASAYDATGRVTATYEDPDGAGGSAAVQTAATTYDAAGRVLTAKDQRQVAGVGGETQHTYDALGRTTSTKEAVVGGVPASVTAYGHDALDRRTSVEIGSGTASAQVTVYTYDLGGRVTAVDDEFTCATQTFDYRDRATQTVRGRLGGGCATSGSEETTTHTYDGLGRPTRDETAGASRTRDDEYDAAGNRLVSRTWTWNGAWQLARETTFLVNPLDQVSTETITGGSTTKRTYDPAGHVADVCRWEAGSTVGACLPAGTTPWTNPPAHATSSGHDAHGGRVSLTDGTTGATTTYDPAHDYAPAAIYVPTGSGREHQTLYAYDARHRVTGITHQLCVISSGHACSSTTPTGSSLYTYDTTDNRTRVQESNGAVSVDRHFCYDARHQLVAADSVAGCTSGVADTATYDAAGNRTDWTDYDGLRVRTAFDAAGRLCDLETGSRTGAPAASCTGGNVVHDDAGRITEFPDGGGGAWRILAYDALGRVTEICDAACSSGSPHLWFTYDAEGRRTGIDYAEGGTGYSVTFRYAGRAISAEYRDGVLVREYLADEAGGISALVIPAGQDNPGTYLVVWNGHGDATGLWRIRTDGSLELANAFSYDPWGAPAISSTTNSATGQPYGDLGFRFLYVGRYGVAWDGRDGPPLYHMGARHYHATLGRFLTPDPAALEANLYGYAENNPLTKIDPEGEAAMAIPLAVCLATPSCVAAIAAGTAWGAAFLAYVSTQLVPWPRITIPCLWDCGPRRQVLRADPSNLPRSGDRRYIPPRVPGNPPFVRHRGGGFVDKWGNVWEWARPGAQHGGPHWDVQHPGKGGKHTNVDKNGKVIGKDNFPHASR